MDITESVLPLLLSDSRLVSVCTTDKPFVLKIENSGSVDDILEIPYPESGFGGGYLKASPEEAFLALSYYSGQSEECFLLFRLDTKLHQVAASGYMFGEASSCAFSPDEDIFVFALPFSCSEWWQPWDDEDTEVDYSGQRFFDFGRICLQPTSGGDFSTHTLRITPPESWEPIREDYDPFLKPDFHGIKFLAISMPWGVEILSLPLESIVYLSPPGRRTSTTRCEQCGGGQPATRLESE